MKSFAIIAVVVYAGLGVTDYFHAKKIFKAKDCKAWMSHPWYVHLLMPGPGNYCIDSGKWP